MWQVLRRQLRRPMMPLLVILQVAFACAISCNALFLLSQQLRPVLASDGIDHPAQLLLLHNIAARGDPWSAARIRSVESELAIVPGVRFVSYAATLPAVSSSQWTQDIRTEEGSKITVTVYFGDNSVSALGLRLISGRNFDSEEERSTLDVNRMSAHKYGSVIVTQTLADRLYPGGNALGRTLPNSNAVIIGVVEHLIRNDQAAAGGSLEYAILVPGVVEKWPVPMFAVRSTDADVGQMCTKLRAVLGQELGDELMPGSVIECDSYTSMRALELASPLAAVWLLSGVTLIVIIVTLTGIIGMTSYWVQQRTRSIGVCRALGATRRDIAFEVMFENVVVVGVGALLGLVVAYSVNLWLMGHYEMSHLPFPYFPIGGALLLVLGQVAALVPARRASNISPIVATRAM